MRLLPILLMLLVPFHAMAQDKPPIEIEADQQLEWLRNQHMYRGTGNVMIKQGTTIIRGDVAEAYYDGAIGPSALTNMIVTGNVVITDQTRIIHADHGTYDIATQKLVLTGKKIILDSPQADVSATGSMTYDAAENKATATGDAEIVQPGQRLKADTVTAWLEKGTNKLQRAEAKGHVIITRDGRDGKEIIQSQRAVYDTVKNRIDLTGDVRLTRGSNHMQGSHATIDMTTGYSSLQNDQKGGRVRAVFAPGGSSPLPKVTGGVPMVNSKKNFEQPYALGVKNYEEQRATTP